MTKLFRGNPRLLLSAAPWVALIVALKWLASTYDLQPLELSPLLAGAIGAEVFIVGFLLSGTAGDFKEAERLPGEVAASLETMADECLIVHQELGLPEAKACLAQLVEIGHSVREWLLHNRGFDDVMSDIRALNGPFIVFAPAIQAGFTSRLKGEQATIRRLVIRMDTMRRTSYVAAGYLIAEIVMLALVLVMLGTDLGATAPTLCLVGLISSLLIYMLSLIRDLDNPFEYVDGRPGAADVSLDVLERNEDRIRALLGSLDAGPVGVAVGMPDRLPEAAAAPVAHGDLDVASVAPAEVLEPPV